ncbi:MAG TPA: hypothetical protein VFM37_13915 [Pseudonocardiaceae bacterium]|nr:hypothetical protein [Pseudonocardiaceae bacterium]
MRLGRPRAGAKDETTGEIPKIPGRHRQSSYGPPPALPEGEPDHELEAYLAALAPTPSDPYTTDPGKRFGTAQVHQLRLPAEADERLRGLAIERGTSPLSLLQDWVLQRLEWELRGRRR